LPAVSAAVLGIEAALTAGKAARGAVALKWGGFVAAATAASLVTPSGLEGLLFPIRVLSMSSLGELSEWRSADFARPTPLEIGLFFAIFMFAWRGVRMGAGPLVLLLGFTHLALQHIRQEAVLAIAAPLLLAGPLGETLEPALAAAPLRSLGVGGRLPLALGAVAIAALFAWRIADPVVRSDNDSTPVSALAHVPLALRAQPVFNDYSFGGWLIFQSVRPFIDGRADLYGDAFVKRYIAVERDTDPAAAARTFARWNIDWAILTPDSRLAAALQRDPGWRQIYADRWAVVEQRLAPPAGAPR
jgi:hypothetical protein